MLTVDIILKRDRPKMGTFSNHLVLSTSSRRSVPITMSRDIDLPHKSPSEIIKKPIAYPAIVLDYISILKIVRTR
jgi:hypothetical protein